jgi:hypothetical protein
MGDKYEELGCEFLNESECEEEVDEEGLDFEDVESEHFNDGKEDK